MKLPHIAVVGHPNKGKSSIVAALAEDDSVIIRAQPGTTTVCREFPMRVDGEVLYILVDTPGFQRPRKVLHWMKQHETSAATRPSIVQSFSETPGMQEQFPDEVELLKPLIKGAGILYVVDGAIPYSVEYEPEMEILRWAGRPSMAVVNPIGEACYVDEWRKALGQYFSVVRVFQPLEATFEKRLELLEAFQQLDEDWKAPLQKAIQKLRHDREQKCEAAASVVCDGLFSMLTATEERSLLPDKDVESYKPELEQKFMKKLRSLEAAMRRSVERVYQLPRLEAFEDELSQSWDLFSASSLELFGLKQSQLLSLGAISGGAVGAAIDMVTGGASLFTGSIVGGTLGAIASFFSSGRLSQIKILHYPLGKKVLQVGPVADANFPFVILNRARLHLHFISRRTHAERSLLDLTKKEKPSLSSQQQRVFHRIFRALPSGDPVRSKEALRDELLKLFRTDSIGTD